MTKNRLDMSGLGIEPVKPEPTGAPGTVRVNVRYAEDDGTQLEMWSLSEPGMVAVHTAGSEVHIPVAELCRLAKHVSQYPGGES